MDNYEFSELPENENDFNTEGKRERKTLSIQFNDNTDDITSNNMNYDQSTINDRPKGSLESLNEKIKFWVNEYVDNKIFLIMMGILSLWTLFSDSIRLACTQKSADLSFEVIISIIFFIFAFEVILKSIYLKDYLNIPDWEPYAQESSRDTWKRRSQIGSFYFWLDLFATLSLLEEMPWVIGIFLSHNPNQSNSGDKLLKLLCIVRLVKLVRVIQLLKVDKLMEKRPSLKRSSSTSKDVENPKNVDEIESEPKSHVGAAMTELTNRRVIILILVMFVIIPLLTTSNDDLSLKLASEFVFHVGALNQSDPTLYHDAFQLTLENTIANTPVIGIYLNDHWYFKNSHLMNTLRYEEKVFYSLQGQNYYTKLEYNQRHVSVATAQFSIWTTIFIIFLLMASSYFFSRDVNNLVIKPIERMVSLVKKISENPLGVEYKILGDKDGFAEGMETTILLATITKIGGLMRVGFGEAGAGIIARNLADSASGRLNLMNVGNKINSIFGFCDVRQFTDTTECLQEEVMLFVNRIAHILHSIVVQCSGAANKNIGDAFLLTWKIDESLSAEQVNELADQALLAFCKTLIELSRQHDFICNFSTAATARLLQRFPGYSVRIGCGLHLGWAIEGAIGSNRKIDASYLSPNVSFTEFLESSTKQYGVSMLLSEQFFVALSPEVQRFCRMIDRVKKEEGSVGLYTYDTDLTVNWEEFEAKKRFAVPGNRHLSHAIHKRASRRTSQTRHSLTLQNGLSLAQINAASLNSHHHSNESSLSQLAHSPHSHLNPHMSLQRMNVNGHLSVQFNSSRYNDIDQSNRNLELRQLRNQSLEKQLRHISMKDLDLVNNNKVSLEAPTIVLPKYDVKVWEEDIFLVELRNKVNDGFRKRFKEGVDHYIGGNWEQARQILQELYTYSEHKDGPTKYLLSYMGERAFNAPHDWPGYSMDSDGGH